MCSSCKIRTQSNVASRECGQTCDGTKQCNMHRFYCSSADGVQRGAQHASCSWLNEHSFHSHTSGRVQIPAGSHLGQRHAEQPSPARPIPSQTESAAPQSTHVERRSRTVLNQPTQAAASAPSEATSCRAAPGSESGRPLVARRSVAVHYRHVGAVWLDAHPNENVWRHLSHMKSIILTRLESTRPYLRHTYEQCFPEFDMLILIISDVLLGSCMDYNLTQTNLKAR